MGLPQTFKLSLKARPFFLGVCVFNMDLSSLLVLLVFYYLGCIYSTLEYIHIRVLRTAIDLVFYKSWGQILAPKKSMRKPSIDWKGITISPIMLAQK